MKRLLALILSVLMVGSVFAGCKKEETAVNIGEDTGFAFNEAANEVDDSSDLPDWTGKKLELKYWYAHGSASASRSKKATQDVVTDEIFRVTGVKYSSNSFDNNGELIDTHIAKMMASNDWPDIVDSPEKSTLEKMIEADLVYDLTDLIPKYCPNITAMANKYGDKYNYLKSVRPDGKIYELPVGVNLDRAEKDLPIELLTRVKAPAESRPLIYVRDDILKEIYPEAKTQDEIEALFVQNGKFTEEEVFDVPMNSKEEFFDFLRKIKAMGRKEGNFDVYPTYVADGYDNWSLLSCFCGPLYGYGSGGGSMGANYFSYWDNNDKKVKYFFDEPQFKEVMKDWTKLVQEDIVSPESLIDDRAAFEQKVNNGAYAVLYGSPLPEQNTLNKALEGNGKNFKYRKVYLDIAPDSENYTFGNASYGTNGVAILKSGNIKPEDLPQVLRYFDFALSQAGQKLAYWGPRSAGLWKEEDGKRVFVDKELEEEMVYNVSHDKKVYYNLCSAAWPGYPFMNGSIHQPKLVYDIKPSASMTKTYFASGVVKPMEFTEAVTPNLWTFDTQGVEGVAEFWQARSVFEDAIKKVFITANDEEFEAKFQEMVDHAHNNGLTEETLEEINKVYREVINAPYMSNIE